MREQRAQKAILALLDKQKKAVSPNKIFDELSDSFDELTLRRALLELVTRQEANWEPGRRLSRRHPDRAELHA